MRTRDDKIVNEPAHPADHRRQSVIARIHPGGTGTCSGCPQCPVPLRICPYPEVNGAIASGRAPVCLPCRGPAYIGVRPRSHEHPTDSWAHRKESRRSAPVDRTEGIRQVCCLSPTGRDSLNLGMDGRSLRQPYSNRPCYRLSVYARPGAGVRTGQNRA